MTVVYPRPAQTVFAALWDGLPRTHLIVTGSDPSRGIVWTKSGITLTSWGENVTITVWPTGSEQTAVTVKSRYKFQLYSLGAGHRRNFDAVFGMLSWVLQTPPVS